MESPVRTCHSSRRYEHDRRQLFQTTSYPPKPSPTSSTWSNPICRRWLLCLTTRLKISLTVCGAPTTSADCCANYNPTSSKSPKALIALYKAERIEPINEKNIGKQFYTLNAPYLYDEVAGRVELGGFRVFEGREFGVLALLISFKILIWYLPLKGIFFVA